MLSTAKSMRSVQAALSMVTMSKRGFALYKEWDVWSYRKQQGHYEPKEYAYKKPDTVSQQYNDVQGPRNFVQEGEGLNVFVGRPDTSIAKIQAVENPYQIPKKIHYSSKDTYTSYSKRMHKQTMKAVRAYMSAVTDKRMELFDSEVERRVREIKNRQEVLGRWKREVKDTLHKNIAIRTQKRASELLHHRKIAMENHDREIARQTEKQRKQLEIMLHEKNTTWLISPDRVTEDIFADDRVSIPTGWWGTPEPSSVATSTFDTDDEDRATYFTTRDQHWAARREVYGEFPIEVQHDKNS